MGFNLRRRSRRFRLPDLRGRTDHDVAYIQFFQGDQLRSSKNTSSGAITQGRRVIGVPMHDPAVMNPPTTGPVGSVLLGRSRDVYRRPWNVHW